MADKRAWIDENVSNSHCLSAGQVDALYGIINKRDRITVVEGIAGSGKSHILTLLDEYLTNNPSATHIEELCVGNCVQGHAKLAPTGIAAVNVGGITIDRFLGGYKHVNNVQKIYASLEVSHGDLTLQGIYDRMFNSDLPENRIASLVVDEGFMVPYVNLCFLMKFIPECGRIFFFGDPYQLLPVVVGSKISYTLSDFMTLKNMEPYALSEIVRNNHVGLQNFQKWLQNAVKFNNSIESLHPKDLRILKEFTVLNNQVKFMKIEGPKTYLCYTNFQCDAINADYLKGIDSKEWVFKMICEDKYFVEKVLRRKTTFDSTYRYCPILTVKVGATVMVTRNVGGPVVNGTTGNVTNISEHFVTLVDGSGHQHGVCRVMFEIERNKVYQFPIVAARAVTMHKMQGTTIKTPILIKRHIGVVMRVLYMAVTRVTHPKFLYFEKPLTSYKSLNNGSVTRSEPISRFIEILA